MTQLADVIRSRVAWPRCWPYLRAGLITLALASQCVSALPDRALSAAKLERPESKRALRWLGLALRPFGVREPEDVQRLVLERSADQVALRRWLLQPVAPLIAAAAVRQQWHLFLDVSAQPYRLRVDTKADDGTWQALYSANQLDVLGLADMLEYRRLRGAYNPGKYGARAQYPGFVDFLAKRIWAAHPELDTLRVSMERLAVGNAQVQPQVLETVYPLERERGQP